jgi:Flp pilus assembly protein TadD/cell division septation protein DedD
MRGYSGFSMRLAACVVACAGLASPICAVTQYSAEQPETPAASLERCIRTLASSPTDFTSLICAGKSAVSIGDPSAAAGFFARADDVNPRSPLPQAGMGAVAVANGDARGAMPYFTRALQLGANIPLIGADRGLAYDLMGQQQQAQSDYRAALSGPDRDEARRRLALSLAISGDRNGALQTLAPLASRGDPATGRIRAFVLALTGDPSGAVAATDAAMPGSYASAGPFLRRLASLQPGQKAAAVNLGIFPDANGGSLASVAAPQNHVSRTYTSAPTRTTAVTGDRLASIDELLREPSPAPSSQVAPVPAPTAPQVAYNLPTGRPVATAAAPSRQRIWLQLASGSNPADFASQFRRMKSRGPDVFEGIRGYVARSSDRSRLLIGPFQSTDDARTFADDLVQIDINAFSWTNSPSDTIVPLNDAS